MNYMVDSIWAEASHIPQRTDESGRDRGQRSGAIPERESYRDPSARKGGAPQDDNVREELGTIASEERVASESREDDWESERERKIYRARTVGMLRRYMRYSIETGRLPSLLGREFFRAKVTSYTVVTFEDRVIFVHDMETCLEKLDEFSRQIVARHILQEHDRWATARLLNCHEKTVRRLTPLALDMLSEILLDVGLLERLNSEPGNSCQGGLESEKSASACGRGRNKI